MQEILNKILLELEKINKRIDDLEVKMQQNNKEVKQYIDTKLEQNNKEMKQYIKDQITKALEQNNKEIAEELQSILVIIKKKSNPQYSENEIQKDIKRLEEKLDRKIKEDKESFKSTAARLNKIELEQEYFESKIDDLKNVVKVQKIAI